LCNNTSHEKFVRFKGGRIETVFLVFGFRSSSRITRVSDIHHENFRSKHVSDGRQKPRRFKRTAVGDVLAGFFKQAAGARLTTLPATTKKAANTTTPQKIIAAASRPVPFRGMNRTQAADYIGVSASKFDMMVKDGRMPKPIAIEGRKVWDKFDLDEAFEALKAEPSDNPWDHAAWGA
jgi:predicted DNA-binding transcriptional regulator AlpA